MLKAKFVVGFSRYCDLSFDKRQTSGLQGNRENNIIQASAFFRKKGPHCNFLEFFLLYLKCNQTLMAQKLIASLLFYDSPI